MATEGEVPGVSEFSSEVSDWFGVGLAGVDVNWPAFMTADEVGMSGPKLTLPFPGSVS